MNRRELAKNGFLSLFGFLLGKKVEEPEVSYTVTCCTGGPGDWKTICGTWRGTGNSPEDEGYSLSDGTEIEHGRCLQPEI